MGEPNAALTAEAATPLGRRSPSSPRCDREAPEAHNQSTPLATRSNLHGDATPSQSLHQALSVDEGESTPRSEVPSVPDAVSASLTQLHALDPEPSYFSPQPLRLYASPIPRSTPASSDPSPTASSSALSNLADADRPSISTPHLVRPTFLRDLSTASTASNTTVRPNSVEPLYSYTSSSRRDGPVYPNQSYAALQLQQYPKPHIPPIVRSRSSHPTHTAAASLSGLSTFGLTDDHYRDIMESGPRTVGNSPVSSPGLFDPNKRLSRNLEQLNDGLYSTPWLHHTHRQAPKETHIADVQADPISGRKIVNQYEIIDELGRGVHGKVKLGKDLDTGRYVAIKIVDRYSKRRRLGKSTSHEDKIKREIAILKKARHPNIVSLLEVIDDPAKKKVYIVLEHVELGEVKWRTQGAKEICLVEWRRFMRESQGIFDNDSAALEDEKIIRVAHQKLERQKRCEAREARRRKLGNQGRLYEPWSLEFGMDSEDDESDAGRSSRASNHEDTLHHSQRDRKALTSHDSSIPLEGNMETAFRSPTPASASRPEENDVLTGLEGTMYGAYDTELARGRAPSLAGSNSSQFTDGEEEIPEHFLYVPLMTFHAAWEAFKDTVLGLEYLHYQKVIHRDIKPANLLVTKEHRIKISDFGVSYLGRQKSEESNGDQSESDYQENDEAIELAKTVGTPAFYAPELCRTEVDEDTPLIDGGIDVWALGVTLYCLIYGRVPFHDTNTFTLMRVISEEEPYIPRYRLKPVSENATSRPSSHGRNSQSMLSSKRAPHDLEYEEVDENLRDLLKRLLIKDSKARITIPQIKRHPWVLSGIPNYDAWVEETDPGKASSGRRIEISKDDVEKAVVPLGIVDRLRSAAKKTTDFITKGFGRSTAPRRRAQSTATHQDGSPSISAASSSSTISQDGRRGSLAPGTILDFIGRSRESEHPLSHSVTASPEARELSRYFDSPTSRTASPAQHTESRPPLQDRALSTIQTHRQADHNGRSGSPIVPPALPGTPVALDSPGGTQLGGLFGGLPRRVVNSMRSRDRLNPQREHYRNKSIDRLAGGDDDPHGAPSLAISTTTVTGHVDQPDALKELSPSLRGSPPTHSDMHSIETGSRQSSMSSLSSRLHQNWIHATEHELGPTLSFNSDFRSQYSQSPTHSAQHFDPGRRPSIPTTIAREASEASFGRAKEEFIQRKIREESLFRRRSTSSQQRPPSAPSESACPPSPDDEVDFPRQKVEDYLNHNGPSSENSPVGGQERGLAFCSSEEQFTPMSQSTSNPSIPSVASAGSFVPDGCAQQDRYADIVPTASHNSIRINQFDTPVDDPAGYDGDHAIDSEEDYESDEDAGLFIGKKKPASKIRRSNSISNAELARGQARQALKTTGCRRSARSGSNGTVKKVPPPALQSDEQTPTPPETTPSV